MTLRLGVAGDDEEHCGRRRQNAARVPRNKKSPGTSTSLSNWNATSRSLVVGETAGSSPRTRSLTLDQSSSATTLGSFAPSLRIVRAIQSSPAVVLKAQGMSPVRLRLRPQPDGQTSSAKERSPR
jgi:hypothetical protein